MTGASSRRDLLMRSGVLAIVDAAPGRRTARPRMRSISTSASPTKAASTPSTATSISGTGIRTALAQIVAEELDVPLRRASTMVLGDTESAPNQGATIASETIQVTADAAAHRGGAGARRIWSSSPRRRSIARQTDVVTDRRRRRARARRTGQIGGLSPTCCAISRIHLHARPQTRRSSPSPSIALVGQPVEPRRHSGQGDRAASSMCMTCACPACCMAASCGRRTAGVDGGDFIGRSLESVDRAVRSPIFRASWRSWSRATSSASSPSARNMPPRPRRG